MDAIEVTSALAQSAGDLAEVHGLRGYDAVHLAAAVLIAADVVVSADADLLAAATARGLATIDSRS
jgi:predicted nucleic acid-binding protein